MKRKRTTVLATLLLLALLPGILLVWGFALPPQYEESFLGELAPKVEMLDSTPGPRLVLVGGSALAFGVDSERLERELPGYHVVNFGLYAALGTTVMLDLSEPLLREGDLVLLVPEQQSQTLSDFFDPAVMWQGLDGAWKLLPRLPAEKLGRLAGAFPAFAGRRFHRFLEGGGAPDGVYRRDSFNDRGDVDSPLCAANVMPGLQDSTTPIRFGEEMVTETFAERVRSYAQAAAKRGATVWYGLCPMNAAAVQGTKEEMDFFYAALPETLGIPLAGNPHDFILEAGWFYDTNFHLNSAGRVLYTLELARAVKAMLGDSSPTERVSLTMPEPAAQELWRGDDSDASCFRLEAEGEGFAVTGLTEEGRARNSLTVPSTWEDRPVLSISSGAFADAPNLQTLTIQRNLRAIRDGAFAGCRSLERVILEQPVPSALAVGQGLREGTDAVFLVPADSLSAYRTDYFWSIYASAVRPRD